MTIAHPSGPLDEELGVVEGDLQGMAEVVRAQMDAVVRLLDRDRDRGRDDPAYAIIERDRDIDVLERRVGEAVQRALALRQPVAGDLRRLISCDRIAGDLERIGDHLKNIARRLIRIRFRHVALASRGISDLSLRVSSVLDTTLDALAHWDDEAAQGVFGRDFGLDLQYGALAEELMQRLSRDHGNPTACVQLILVAKSLERIGDHATNIAEDIVYAATGERPPERLVVRTD